MGREPVEAIAARCGVAAERGHTMAEYTTIGVGGPVAWVLKPDSIGKMGALLSALRHEGWSPRVVGGGANLIAGAGPFDEPVILTRPIRHGPLFEANRVRAGCGVVLKKLVMMCVDQGLAGLEFAEGIPGTVGGTLYMNAGSYGGQISDVVREMSYFDAGGALRTRGVTPADFGYRRSPLGSGDVVVEAVYELTPGDPAELRRRVTATAARRSASQPPGERSAGCVFRNPPGDSAGRLIDQLGLKGLAVGGASVSAAHGNFIVNRGDATPEDVLGLIDSIKKEVRKRAGVELQEEVIVWT